MARRFRALIGALALAFAPIPAPASAETVVVTADRMVDVLAGRVVEEPVVVITDGRIAAVVGRGGARPVIPEGARRIDLPGMTILPGLIDMHVHLDSSPYYGGLRIAAVHRPVPDGDGARATPATCSRRASPRCATSAPTIYADVALHAGDRRGPRRRARASSPPRMR